MSHALLLTGIALLSLTVAEAWRRWALRRGVIDVPGERSSHTTPTPRGAGIGPVVALLVGLPVLIPASPERDAIWLSIAGAAAIGLFDDLRPLLPLLKLLGQVLAGLPMAIALPVTLPVTVDTPLEPITAVIGVGLALGIGVLLVNAWNFMDGIDGIATLAAGAVALVAVATGSTAAVLALIVLAACLGFLPLNFPRAKAFLGDCGSHALGMAMAALILWSFPMQISFVLVLACSPFMIDVLGTLARRARDGEPLIRPHRRHLYQLAVRRGYSHARVALTYLVWMIASGAGVAALGIGTTEYGVAAVILLVLNTGLWWVATGHFEKHLRKEGRW